jgi:hypothetical protein
MKHCLCVALAIILTVCTYGQSKLPPVDQSPMDMSYYPVNYPVLKIQDKITEPLVARVIYSRPQRNGRGVFGELVEYEKVWRVGANEATEIEFFKDVIFNGKAVPRGRYTLYATPALNTWTVIINKETDTWGSFKYDSKKDLVRVDVPAQKLPEASDVLSIYFDKTTPGFNLCIAWEYTGVSIPVSVSTGSAVKTSAPAVKKK